MTRKEFTGLRNLDFSQWVRHNLPDSSTGFFVSDLDFIFMNHKSKIFALVEVKTRNKIIEDWQFNMLNFLSKCIKNGIYNVEDGWIYKGLYTIRFENTGFNDGMVYLNGSQSSEHEIRKIFSF